MVAGAFPSLLSAPCPVFQRTPVFFKLPTKYRRFHSVYTHLQAFHAASVDSEVTNDNVGDISASLGQELGTHSQPKAQLSKNQNTIDNISELLGIQTSQALDSSPQSTQSVADLKAVAASIQDVAGMAEAAEGAESALASSQGSAGGAASPPASPEQRREKLLRRKEMLSQRQRAVQEEHERHARRLAWHQQQLATLRQQYSQLAAQQQSIQEELDPEAAAAWRTEQEERRKRGTWQMVLLLAGLQVAFGLIVGLTMYQLAVDLQQALQQRMMEW